MNTTQALLDRYHTIMSEPGAGHRQLLNRVFARQLSAWLPGDKAAPILDAGCGGGELLDFLRSRGFSALDGFDYSGENVEVCRQAGFPFVRQADLLKPEGWGDVKSKSLILLMDVLEHLPKEDALRVLVALRERLRADGGSLVLRTPNMGSLFASWLLHSDLSHSWGCTETSLRELLILAGFDAQSIEIVPAWDAATATGRLRELVLRVMHRLVFMTAGRPSPRIPTRNLLARAVRRDT